jgi:hypothetical protein
VTKGASPDQRLDLQLGRDHETQHPAPSEGKRPHGEQHYYDADLTLRSRVSALGARRLFVLWRKNTWIGRWADHRDRRLGLGMLVTAKQSW